MQPRRDNRLRPYPDVSRTRHDGVCSREDWIEIALASIEYEFSMLQLERNNLASMLQLYEQDKAHLED
ncbi:unnamed protein product [Penicillium pancosmium]